ncbi:DNA-directed RNA polymerase subunit A'' [Halobacteriales archaeon SW_5_68_122]|nr:MAG: DNA-directed RNA polymerase subunit A'' [Halobacteriales archaeon SW_5_68_122]
MTEVGDDIEAVVERSDLPRRLKKEVYETVRGRDDVELDHVEDIVQAVESEYLETRVDPLDPVGTVSAQSIGEPGTQMSLPASERVIIRRNGETDVTEISQFVDSLMDGRETREFDGHEVALAPEGLEVPSLSTDETVEWKPLEEVSRHETPDELLRFELESGRTIRATKAHSFVTRRDNGIVPVAGEALEPGDWLPVVASLDAEATGTDAVDLREYLPPSDYWYTSTLADGGVESVPAGADQLRNKRSALESGDIDKHTVYPVGGTVGLPEEFPLDDVTGFFIGAWLAEGSSTDHYVSVSNVDPDFQHRVRAFAKRFDLSVSEYENSSGFATGYDIRVNGTVLADFLQAACVEDGEKVVPGFAFGATDRFAAALLRGYLSGDGSVGTNAVRASSTSDRLIAGVSLLLARFDVYSTLGEQDSSRTLRVPKKHVPRFADRVGLVGERGHELESLAAETDPNGPDATDQVPNFGGALGVLADAAGIPSRQVNAATNRQRIGRNRLALETFTTAEGVVTHNTMNTFHYAGVAEIDVTQGLPRLIELVDARKTPDTPMMTVHLDEGYAADREKAHEVVWKIEATRILALGDVSTNVADMLVRIDLNEETLAERWPTVESLDDIAGEIAGTIESALGVDTVRPEPTVVEFGPDQPSYRELLQLVEELREIVFKGIEEIDRVVIRKEELEDDEEFVLYTEGSSLKDVLDIEGVDASRSTCNNIHEIKSNLGIEAAREKIINETMDTLAEQGLDDVNIRHLMLVADIMTNNGEIESIGRHGISGNKDSVLARAAFEVTVNHLLDAAIHGEVDELDGVTENVIVGKPIKLGTGDVDLRMSAKRADGGTADD